MTNMGFEFIESIMSFNDVKNLQRVFEMNDSFELNLQVFYWVVSRLLLKQVTSGCSHSVLYIQCACASQ